MPVRRQHLAPTIYLTLMYGDSPREFQWQLPPRYGKPSTPFKYEVVRLYCHLPTTQLPDDRIPCNHNNANPIRYNRTRFAIISLNSMIFVYKRGNMFMCLCRRCVVSKILTALANTSPLFGLPWLGGGGGSLEAVRVILYDSINCLPPQVRKAKKGTDKPSEC